MRTTDVVIEMSPMTLLWMEEDAADPRPVSPLPSQTTAVPWDGVDPGAEPDDEGTLHVRPYVRARGRAAARYELEFETLLTTTGKHLSWSGERELSADQLTLCRLCDAPRSVAEIAVELDVAIGVAKVLISDVIDQGLLELQEMTPMISGRPPMELLKRVHAGIAKLA
ncbi:DUF742 domain-containing protein [Amycolatopsis pithecellobii]|uniref:DUF742 domain-containing protein n=1 Tax=Amycolatopsis pithecellobii TaxID=664692 RepID=UPI00140C32C5|nr:DUF742 domain-containing protein [Amycolatopsis pithecellobii]